MSLLVDGMLSVATTAQQFDPIPIFQRAKARPCFFIVKPSEKVEREGANWTN
jgi:hypothetical protein